MHVGRCCPPTFVGLTLAIVRLPWGWSSSVRDIAYQQIELAVTVIVNSTELGANAVRRLARSIFSLRVFRIAALLNEYHRAGKHRITSLIGGIAIPQNAA